MSLTDRVLGRVIGRATPPPEALATPPQLEPSVLEVHAVAAVARIDAALQLYGRNRAMAARELADALLEVRYRLVQGLPGGEP